MFYIIVRFIFFVIFKLLFGLTAHNKENIPKRGGFLMASNHVSNLDPMLIGVVNYRRINYMGKAELFHNIVLAFILRRMHVFPVKRDKTDIGSMKEAIRRIQKGEGLLLFPQGARSDSIDTENLRAGIGLFASKTGVPIVPVFVKGSNHALPKGKKLPRRTKIDVYFGTKISYKFPQTYSGFAEEVMSAIQKLAHRSSLSLNPTG